jgi:hypothetical protein
MFAKPIFKTSDFIKSANIPRPTATRILREARDKDFCISQNRNHEIQSHLARVDEPQ